MKTLVIDNLKFFIVAIVTLGALPLAIKAQELPEKNDIPEANRGEMKLSLEQLSDQIPEALKAPPSLEVENPMPLTDPSQRPPSQDISQWLENDYVILQGLDKITARVFSKKVRVNQLVKFGTLEIYVRAAYRSPPSETPDYVCFMEIYELKPHQPRALIFSGWMFASNPAISALEHPVLDVWVKDPT